MKQFFISTPKFKPSNIENMYMMGDQRKWHVPCPKCGEYIELLWFTEIEGDKCGIIFEKDEKGRLIANTIKI